VLPELSFESCMSCFLKILATAFPESLRRVLKLKLTYRHKAGNERKT